LNDLNHVAGNDFTHIVHERLTAQRINIFFTQHAFRYLMTVGFQDGTWYAENVYHKLEPYETCPYCQRGLYQCVSLSETKETLFQKLIQSHAFRLHWLFVEHT